MQATAERAMGGGFWQNSVSELKLKNRCTGSTKEHVPSRLNNLRHQVKNNVVKRNTSFQELDMSLLSSLKIFLRQ